MSNLNDDGRAILAMLNGAVDPALAGDRTFSTGLLALESAADVDVRITLLVFVRDRIATHMGSLQQEFIDTMDQLRACGRVN